MSHCSESWVKAVNKSLIVLTWTRGVMPSEPSKPKQDFTRRWLWRRWSDRVKVFLISVSLHCRMQQNLKPSTRRHFITAVIGWKARCSHTEVVHQSVHSKRSWWIETGRVCRLIIPDNPLWSLDWARAKLTISLIWPHNHEVFFLSSITGAAPWWQFKSTGFFFLNLL